MQPYVNSSCENILTPLNLYSYRVARDETALLLFLAFEGII